MQLFKTDNAAQREAGIAAAIAALGRGRLVAIPTETVYGLAADATNGRAVAGIYTAKGRPRFNPLIAHVADLAEAREHGDFDPTALKLAEAFWPGPLTLVVPRRAGSGISDLATAGLDSVGLRVPAEPTTRALLARHGRPLAAPSANRSGHVSPTRAGDVVADLGASVDVVLDAGPCRVGIELTIVACLDGHMRLLRPGGIARGAIEAAADRAFDAAPAPHGGEAPMAPGMLASHYAPRAMLRLDATVIAPGEAYLGFAGARPEAIEKARAVYDLSARGDLAEAAANLFHALRLLDASGAATIAVAPIPAEGLGEAILDRLGRAAAQRPDVAC